MSLCCVEMTTRIHAGGAAINIFDGDLGFSIGAEEINDVLLADFSELVRKAVRELDGHGHQLGRFVAGIAEHQALVAGAAGVNTHGDVRRLFVNGADYAAGFGVEAKFGASVADVADDFAREVGKVHVSGGGDLAGDYDQASGDQGLAGDAAHGIVFHDGVEDGVGNLVGDFVGMALGYGFRGEEKLFIVVSQNSILQRSKCNSGAPSAFAAAQAQKTRLARGFGGVKHLHRKVLNGG